MEDNTYTYFYSHKSAQHHGYLRGKLKNGEEISYTLMQKGDLTVEDIKKTYFFDDVILVKVATKEISDLKEYNMSTHLKDEHIIKYPSPEQILNIRQNLLDKMGNDDNSFYKKLKTK